MLDFARTKKLEDHEHPGGGAMAKLSSGDFKICDLCAFMLLGDTFWSLCTLPPPPSPLDEFLWTPMWRINKDLHCSIKPIMIDC